MRLIALALVGVLFLAACGASAPKWTAQQAIDSFKAAGLEAESPQPMTRQDLNVVPYVTDDMIHFLIPSLCPDCGGRVFAVKDEADIAPLKTYYESLGKSSAAFYSHVLVRDNILVQINGELSDETAAQYRAALESMR